MLYFPKSFDHKPFGSRTPYLTTQVPQNFEKPQFKALRTLEDITSLVLTTSYQYHLLICTCTAITALPLAFGNSQTVWSSGEKNFDA